MGDETWANIQLVKSKRESFREKIKKRKAERETILSSAGGGGAAGNATPPVSLMVDGPSTDQDSLLPASPVSSNDASFECVLLECLNEALPPVQSIQLAQELSSKVRKEVSVKFIENFLQKFAYKELISISQGSGDNRTPLTITAVQHTKVTAVLSAEHRDKRCRLGISVVEGESKLPPKPLKSPDEHSPKLFRSEEEIRTEKEKRRENRDDDVMSLLSAQSIRERETKKVGEEIMELLSKPTAKEQSLAQRFRSQG
ncbi:hypothetical protein SK128_022348, partial [Halocaridina rubra]